MKILFNIIALIALVGISTTSSATFFSDTVHTVRVYFANPTFWPALDSTHITEEYIMCRVVIDNTDSLDSVGIRLKGNSSYNHPGNKKPFFLKFDQYRDSQEFKDLERMSFNNCYHDPTFIREKLSVEVFHGLGVPCPRATWSVVYFNDEYWGFYTTVDPINQDALTRFFSYNDGNLYDCDYDASLKWLGTSVSSYRNRYIKQTNIAEDC